jgi:arginase family enzyme
MEVVGAPLLDPSDVALLGFRDLDEARGLGSVTPDDLPGMLARDTDAIRRDGPARTAADARAAVAPGGRPFAVFIDLDILDPSVFPNDAPVPDGSTGRTCATCWRPWSATRHAWRSRWRATTPSGIPVARAPVASSTC